jgi:hypothetical protein
MNRPRKGHTGKSPTEKRIYKRGLKEPKAADLTLPDNEDKFTMPPSQNESNIKTGEKVEHRPYRRSKAKKKVDLNLTKLILEIGSAIVLAVITLLTVTLNREVGEHGVKIGSLKDGMEKTEIKIEKCMDKIDDIKNTISNIHKNTP